MARYREVTDRIKPAIPYIALYDVGGGQTIDGSFLTWDGIKTKTSHFTYEEDDDRVQLSINSSGLFEITFDVSISGGGICYFQIFKNGALIPESKMYAYTSGSMHLLTFLEKDDYIQVKGTNVSGTTATHANSSRLKIKALPMEGWDNNHAGRKLPLGDVK